MSGWRGWTDGWMDQMMDASPISVVHRGRNTRDRLDCKTPFECARIL